MDDAPPALHVIRLRGAWTLTQEGTRVRHTRRFGGVPTAAGERIWLACALLPAATCAILNGVPLGQRGDLGTFYWDVTDALLPRNEIAFLVESALPIGEVTLRIHANSGPG